MINKPSPSKPSPSKPTTNNSSPGEHFPSHYTVADLIETLQACNQQAIVFVQGKRTVELKDENIFQSNNGHLVIISVGATNG